MLTGNMGKISQVNKATGFTLIEIVFAVTLLSIIALGTAQYMVYARWDIDRGIRRQLAWINMASRMEQAIDYGYDAIPDSLPEVSTTITINRLQAYRTTIVTGIDDALDGSAPTDTAVPDYLEIKIYISWFVTDNISDSITTYLGEETGWAY